MLSFCFFPEELVSNFKSRMFLNSLSDQIFNTQTFDFFTLSRVQFVLNIMCNPTTKTDINLFLLKE